MEMVYALKDKDRVKSIELFFLFTWSFWHCWNKWVYEKCNTHLVEAVKNALSLQQWYNKMRPVPIACIRDQAKWCKPPPKFVKLNVDGAIFFDYLRAGIGLILRDDKGDFMFVASVAKKGLQEPKTI